MAKAKEDTQVNESAFLKSLNKAKAAAKAASKAERPNGPLDDAAIMARLGLDSEGDRITVNGRVSKVQMGFAKKDTARPYFRFAYSLTENSPNSDKGKGLIVSTYHELTEAEKDVFTQTFTIWSMIRTARTMVPTIHNLRFKEGIYLFCMFLASMHNVA